MKIIYLGPRDQIAVVPYGEHWQNKIKEYPDDFAEELLATNKKQQFEMVDDDTGEEVEIAVDGSASVETGEPGFEEWTVKQFTAELEARGIEIPKKARKAELIELLRSS